MNNGPDTGASVEAWSTLRSSPGLLDLWQLHRATRNDSAHNTDAALIANLDEHCAGSWIRIAAAPSGAFTVLNQRTGFSKTY